MLKKLLLGLVMLLSYSIIGQTIVDTHGRLRVQGNQIVDQFLNPTSLAGNSLFWSNADDTANYYNAQTVNHLADDWNSSLIRCAMGVTEPWDNGRGYIDSPNLQETKIRAVIDAAIAKGIYVIIDWHTHEAELYEDEAVEFFTKMAQIYGDHPNVIYEIYNEPINQSWSTIKNYAEAVIAGIRSEDPDNLIIVGTPFFSQNVDVASQDPIDDVNTAYTLHFYAGTHGNSLRDRATRALNNGIALFVTEWGTVNADGNGNPNNQSTQTWMNFLEENNISHANWAVSDKNEGASIVRNGNGVSGLVNGQLTASGNLVRNIIRNWSPSTTTNTGRSEVNFTTPSGNRTVQQGYTSLEIEATGTVSSGSISSMSLFINDVLVRQENVAPYEWGNGNNSDETLGLSVGAHDFRVVMRDSNGNLNEDQFVLTVTSNNQGGRTSEVNFTTPSGNRTVQQGYTSLEIEATGTVNGGSISRMSLFIDDEFIRHENIAPYEWGNDNNVDETLGLSVGDHEFRVVMRDSNGNFYVDRFVLTVTSNNQGGATSVNFIRPSGNRTVQQGYNSLRIEAVGNVNGGTISRMSLLIDNQLVRHEFRAPYEWGIGNNASETLGLSVGQHVIRVLMRDNSGNFYDDRFTLTVTRNRRANETDTAPLANTLSIAQTRILEESIKVFPNPASQEFFIDGLPDRAGEVQVVDMLGRTVLTKQIAPEDHYVDISTLSSSNYIILFVYDDKVISRKLVKTE